MDLAYTSTPEKEILEFNPFNPMNCFDPTRTLGAD
jgi:hypothetical protein